MNATAASSAAHAAVARRRSRARFEHGPPIRRIDTLPILLFLCALVAALLATWRPPPQALVIDLPPPLPVELRPPVAQDMLVLRIGVDRNGRPLFNGTGVTHDQMRYFLAEAARLPLTPGVLFEPDPRARYGDAISILNAIRKAGLAQWQFCFAGLGQHRRLNKDWRVTARHLSLVIDPAKRMPIPPEPIECDPRRLRPPLPAPVSIIHR